MVSPKGNYNDDYGYTLKPFLGLTARRLQLSS